MSHFVPRNPTGSSRRLIPEEQSPYNRAARHIERRTGVPRDVWMNKKHPLNERHYRLMCRIAGVQINKDPRRRAA